MLLTCVVLYTSKLLHCIVYLSANWVRHQSDEALGFGQRGGWANWTKLVCIRWRVPGAPNTVAAGVQPRMTYVDCTHTTSQEDMDMPLLCSTGTRRNYPRKMVLLNAAQAEEQVQQWISHTGYGHEV